MTAAKTRLRAKWHNLVLLLPAAIGVICLARASLSWPHEDKVPARRWSRTLQDQAFYDYVSHFGRPPPVGMDTWLDYANKHQCLTSPAHYAPMYRQLRPFWEVLPKPGITPEMLARGKDKFLLYNIKLANGTAVGSLPDPVMSLYSFVSQKLQEDGGGSVEFWYNGMDEPRVLFPDRLPGSISSYEALAAMPAGDASVVRQACGYERSTHPFMRNPASLDTIHDLLPVFSPATVVGCFADVVVPHYTHVLDLWIDYPSTILWADRREQLLWRGGSTGSNLWGLNRTAWLEANLRLRFVNRFKGKPGFDVGIASFYQVKDRPEVPLLEAEAALKREPWQASPLDYAEHWAYKYLLDIDGNTFSRRFVTFLRNSRSLVFKMTLFQDWPTMFMRPWEHYIPLADTLEDVEERLQHAMKHDSVSHSIADAGFAWSRQHLRSDDITCYVYRLLLEYRRLYRLGHGLPLTE